MNLSKVWTTRKASKILPMTKEQAADMLKTVFRLEVESRWKEFVETPSISKSIDRIAGFLTGETHKTGLFISGRVGNGKTTMMKSIMKLYDYLVSEDYVEYGGPMSGFMFTTAQDLALSLIENKRLYESCKEWNMLMIDDIGEDATEIPVFGVNRNPVKEVLMYRYEHRYLTILSSNLNASLIKAKYHDERLSDRMREMYEVVSFEDNSFRS